MSFSHEVSQTKVREVTKKLTAEKLEPEVFEVRRNMFNGGRYESRSAM